MTQNLTIVIPMAGEGSRFAQAGYAKPKPFIDVLGRPMIRHVIDNVAYPGADTLLIARKAHCEAEPGVVDELKAAGIRFHLLDGLTEGTACTLLAAYDKMDPDSPILVANSDQFVDGGAAAMLDDALARDLDGSIMVFKSEPHPKWSYAKMGPDGLVERVAEKDPISEWATVGLYYFKSARAFRQAALAMIAANDRVNNEFYTCPVYNYLLETGARVGVWEIAQTAMHGLGTPDDLDAFIAERAAAAST
ncbi:Glucose-1-phosphate thymidylyltransferase [Paramagnetospirillum magnetotacticum MS-1]|uniref:Glucose-1-phosphate thymidylyltransferase n=1 Tax=Paramagnetospirillum magnetotacticum MS-1 TaxID=272627 RepID=A0A0C2UXZ5_PARME|nr:glycosyltransferase family 2 protein [Paramagnetospirillum magnetotacticum]KIL97681.1 Glucose-1-phosphate thymidylyltransferase [Paramagnetospirillum magnetotacticum MS-1]